MKKLIKYVCLGLLLTFAQTFSVQAQGKTEKWSIRMADFAVKKWPDAIVKDSEGNPKWSYDEGLLLKGIERVWESTGKGKYFKYMTHIMDPLITPDGSIKGYEAGDYKLDDINNGKILLLLYEVSKQEKYWKAATALRHQLNSQPRTAEGGFWHKKIYPHQMWLDGLYMEAPFYAHYAGLSGQEQDFTDVARQFFLMEKNVRDPQTGLLYHGWDESRDQRWADPVTGRSRNFWGRAMGWYGMALVDALDYIPKDYSHRQLLIHILQRYAKAVSDFQDTNSGLWYQVLNRPDGKGNYHEASASCMFVYALAKGVRKGYLDPYYLDVARRGYRGILNELIEIKGGEIELKNTNTVAGLGGDPYRDGSYDYYINAETKTNDVKGIGAFILASSEIERMNEQPVKPKTTVLLDHYFNNEYSTLAGRKVPYHYTWAGRDNNGFWLLGNQFRRHGAQTSTLWREPTRQKLDNAGIYMIVDPDTKKETDQLHLIEEKDIDTIQAWVKDGGVLVLMGNDKGNAEFEHLNHLADRFGIHFNEDTRNNAHGGHLERGTFELTKSVPFVQQPRKILIQGMSTLKVSTPAQTIFKADNGDDIIAISHFGNGMVFAIGDPWLYNEYIGGRHLPADYQNLEAASDLAKWLIEQVPAND